jgi:shikimate dehydrogenase
VLVVVGDPVAHSLSPTMHNAAIATLGLDAVYVAIPVSTMGLPHLMRGFAAANIAGNVTVPHKVAAAGLIVRLTDLAKELDAVNTFWSEEDRLVGDNTDVAGVLDALDRVGAEPPWLLAGTGGSARAVAAAARDTATPLLVRSRDAVRAREFVEFAGRLGVNARPDDGRSVGTAINATPVGLSPSDPLPVPLERLDGCKAALDLVYAPGETAWCRECRGRGMRVSDGRTVLVGQGLHAFRRFFPDVTPPREVMMGVVQRMLAA